jgi:hypothetical protein
VFVKEYIDATTSSAELNVGEYWVSPSVLPSMLWVGCCSSSCTQLSLRTNPAKDKQGTLTSAPAPAHVPHRLT